jgi:N-methylhydantoinase B
MPEKATAAHYGDSMVAAFFNMDPDKGQWISVEPTAGGWGGTVGADGESGLINLCNGGFRNLPAEVYETKFPVRVEEFSLRRDSGGPGRWRGGCGVVRSYRLLDEAYGALWFERSKTPAWGLAGGGDGEGPANEIIYPDGRRETPLKMRARRFPKGTLFVTRTGGGGGYGDPKLRPVEDVRADVAYGLVSPEAAMARYGVAIGADLTVDETRTEPRR